MKITVDTEKKSIIVEDNVSIKDIMDFMKNAFPKSYEEYVIERTNTVQLTRDFPPYIPAPFQPLINPTVRPWGTEVIY